VEIAHDGSEVLEEGVRIKDAARPARAGQPIRRRGEPGDGDR
jgi:hypothetical protein